MNSLKRKLSLKCDSCDVVCPNHNSLNEHNLSEGHLRKTTGMVELRRPFLINDPSSAVVVSELPPRISVEEIENVFKEYGEIKQTILSKLYGVSTPVCLVEFLNPDSVAGVLKKLPSFNGKTLIATKYDTKSCIVCHEASENMEPRKKVCTEIDNRQSSKSTNPISTPVPLRNGAVNETNAASTSSNNPPAAQKPGEILLKSIEKSNEIPVSKEDPPTVSGISISGLISGNLKVLNQAKNQKDNFKIPSKKGDDKLFDERILKFVVNLQSNLPRLQAMYAESFYSVEKALSLINVEFCCYMFGSSYTGLCREGSDLDVYIQWGPKVTNPNIVLRDCKNALYRSMEFEKVIIINARTPLVKCRHIRTAIDIDISFKSRLGVYNSFLIKLLLEFDQRVKPMIMIMKFWAFKNDLHGGNKMNSYCLSWMIIFFLQLNSILPTVEFLNKFGSHNAYSEWNVSFFSLSVPQIEGCKKAFYSSYPYKEVSLRQLLIDFFNFFLNYDYKNEIICTLKGCSLPRSEFYMMFKIHLTNSKENMFDRCKDLCLQDPIELTFNIGKNVTSKVLSHFQVCCKAAVGALTTVQVDSFIPKFFTKCHVRPEPRKEKPSQPEKSIDTGALFKKSFCYILNFDATEAKRQKKLVAEPFVKEKWISNVLAAFLYFLSKVLLLDISVVPKNECKDAVLIKKYTEFANKLDFDKCKIVYCSSYRFMFKCRKKYKPTATHFKSNVEKEKFLCTQMLEKEYNSRNPKQLEEDKFNFIFLFNPLADEDVIQLTLLRYFRLDLIPPISHYSLFHNYCSVGFTEKIHDTVAYVENELYKEEMDLELQLLCEKFNIHLKSNPQASTSKTVSVTVENQIEAKEGETDKMKNSAHREDLVLLTDSPESVGNVKIEINYDDENENTNEVDSDIEIVPVEPKVIECIDVE